MICDGLGITPGEFFSTPEFDAPEREIRQPFTLHTAPHQTPSKGSFSFPYSPFHIVSPFTK